MISVDKLVYYMVMKASEQETIYYSIELTKLECVQSSWGSQLVKYTQIGIRVVHPISVRWAFSRGPLLGIREVSCVAQGKKESKKEERKWIKKKWNKKYNPKQGVLKLNQKLWLIDGRYDEIIIFNHMQLDMWGTCSPAPEIRFFRSGLIVHAVKRHNCFLREEEMKDKGGRGRGQRKRGGRNQREKGEKTKRFRQR